MKVDIPEVVGALERLCRIDPASFNNANFIYKNELVTVREMFKELEKKDKSKGKDMLKAWLKFTYGDDVSEEGINKYLRTIK